MLSFESEFLIEAEVPNVDTGPDDDIAAAFPKLKGPSGPGQ